MSELDPIFDKEKDVAEHLKQLGVLLLDLSDSVKDKLSEKDIDEIKGLTATFTLNCDAVSDDLKGAEASLKKIRAKTLDFPLGPVNIPEVKERVKELHSVVKRMKASAKEFLHARNRELVFQEMNKDYSELLGTLTELITLSSSA
jgi:DNA repair ATPase RecN